MVPNRILVAIEDPEASAAAIAYVGEIASQCADLEVVLCHVLPPVPPELLEHPGSEQVETEERLDRELEAGQARWRDASPADDYLQEASRALRACGMPAERIETRVLESVESRSVIPEKLVEEARTRRCGTLAVGRSTWSRWRELLDSHVSERLVREIDDLTVWVIV